MDLTSLSLARDELTSAALWRAMSGEPIGQGLLEWPPDLFALTDVILECSEAYRFVLSPPAGASWPPNEPPDWPDAVADAGRRWGSSIERDDGAVPDLLSQEWETLRDGADTPLERLTDASAWRLCQAVLTLHAIADEACVGLGSALDAPGGPGSLYRARARELLARTGTLARIPSRAIRVLPKLRTPANGTSLRSLSRYACALRPGVDARWHKVPGRRPGAHAHDGGLNYLLLPWPLRVREADFHPLEGTVHSLAKDPFGFFEFAPSERLDLDLVDRILIASRDEVESVKVVVMPESAVDSDEIEPLEALLVHHGVQGLVAGVRQRPTHPGQFGRNWVHLAAWTGAHWASIRQTKHHRWALDEVQIEQYHLGGALHPRIRWREAMEVPRRSLQFVQVGEGNTVVSLVCEDLAQIDDVAEVLRSVGPTVVITPLLDGPQLSSRWAARYASVLADDPGSAVLTLTSYGMVRRSRPHGVDPSPVIGLWKDAGRGTREIPLEPGAQGVLVSVNTDRAIRRSTDGRMPVESGNEIFDMSIYQVRAGSTPFGHSTARPATPTPPLLDIEELTLLTSWSEAVAEALCTPERDVDAVLADAAANAPWRATLGLTEPSSALGIAIATMAALIRTITDGDLPIDEFLLRLRDAGPSDQGTERLVHGVLRSALEERMTRDAKARLPFPRRVAGRSVIQLELGTEKSESPPLHGSFGHDRASRVAGGSQRG